MDSVGEKGALNGDNPNWSCDDNLYMLGILFSWDTSPNHWFIVPRLLKQCCVSVFKDLLGSLEP